MTKWLLSPEKGRGGGSGEQKKTNQKTWLIDPGWYPDLFLQKD